MWRAGEETLPRVGDSHPRPDAKAQENTVNCPPMRREQIEVRTRSLTHLRKEKLRHHPERHVNRDEALRRQLVGSAPQQRERELRACGAEDIRRFIWLSGFAVKIRLPASAWIERADAVLVRCGAFDDAFNFAAVSRRRLPHAVA